MSGDFLSQQTTTGKNNPSVKPKKKGTSPVLIIIAVLLLGFAGFVAFVLLTAGPSRQYTTSNVLLSQAFDAAGSWETFGGVSDGQFFRVEGGRYRTFITQPGWVWGQNFDGYTNVVVEVTSQQLSSFEDNAYGVMCRADIANNGNGYYFVISGDGFYSIQIGRNQRVEPLTEWTRSSIINRGQATNTLRAVCIDDYLALWVNGTFLGETTDTTYTSGAAGFAVNVNGNNQVDIAWDNLTVTAASITTE